MVSRKVVGIVLISSAVLGIVSILLSGEGSPHGKHHSVADDTSSLDSPSLLSMASVSPQPDRVAKTEAPHFGTTTAGEPCSISTKLEILDRLQADERYCRDGPSGCLNWTTFPTDAAGECDFLCSQASESKPAVHKQSSLRNSAIVIRHGNGSPASKWSSSEVCSAPFSLINPQKCLSTPSAAGGPSILFIGHSHTRFLVAMLCMMLNATSCKQFEDQFRNVSVVWPEDIEPSQQVAEERQPRLVFVQANYHFGSKLAMVSGMFSPTVWTQFTHIVVSRGSWDLLFYDQEPTAIAQNFESSLTALVDILEGYVGSNAHDNRILQQRRFILHMPHYCHPKMPSGKQKRSKDGPSHAVMRAQWRKKCFAESRVLGMRDINVCAFGRAANSSRNRRALGRWETFDTYSETSSSLAFNFVDELGHHYQDVFLEFLSMLFLQRHVCPLRHDPSTTEALQPASVLEACSRVERASLNYKTMPECACHNPRERRDFICRKFGRSVPDVSRTA